MAEGLEESLILDINEALRGIDQIESALSDSVSRFKVELADALGLLSNVDVSTDATDLTTEINNALDEADTTIDPVLAGDALSTEVAQAIDAADTNVEIEADASNVTAEIDQAIQDVDTTLPDIEVPPIDTSGSDASLGGLQKSISGVGLAAAGLAGGELSSLNDGLGKMGGAGQAAAVGVGALSATTGYFIKNALESDQATARFNLILGDMAGTVEHVDIGGLNEDLGELAERTGQDDEALRQAAASMFQLGAQSGRTKESVAETTDQILALATRAAVLNPSLGQAGDVAARLSTALARGGRFAAQYGLSLTSAEITARALADTGKDTASELTLFEKSAAGAALATDQLGDSLSTTLNEGAETSTIQLQSLEETFKNATEEIGKPLIAPFIEVMRGAQPLLLAVATTFGRLAEALLPLVIELMPPLVTAFEGLDEIIIALVPAIDLAVQIIHPFAQVLRGLGLAAGAVGQTFQALSGQGPLGPNFEAGLNVINEKVQDSALKYLDLGNAIDIVRGKSGEPLLPPVGHDDLKVVSNSIKQVYVETGRLTQANLDAAIAANMNADGTINQDGALKAIKPHIVEAKEKTNEFGAAIEKTTEFSAELTAAVIAMHQGLDPLNPALKLLGTESDDLIDKFAHGTLTIAEYDDIIKKSGVTIQDLTAIQGDVKSKVDEFTKTIQGGLEGLEKSISEIHEHDSLQSFLDNFTNKVTQSALFVANIQKLIDRGATDLASALAESGVKASQAAADAVALSDSQLAKKEEQVKHNEQIEADTNEKLKQFAEDRVANQLEAGNKLDEEATKQAEENAKKAFEAGQKFLDGLIGGFRSKEKEVADTLKSVGGSIVNTFNSILGIHSPSLEGKKIGQFFVQGIALGLSDTTKVDTAVTGLASSLDVVPNFGSSSSATPVVAAGGGSVGPSATTVQGPLFDSVVFNTDVDPKHVFAEAQFKFVEGSLPT